MPVVNDVSGAYDRIKAQADALAAKLGVQKEVVYGYFNSTAHFPQSLAELEAWGNDPTNNQYNVRRRSPTGAWTPIMPGPTPGTGGPDDPGFRHVINNPEDADLQRFQQIDPSGNVFGGSWDPNWNAAVARGETPTAASGDASSSYQTPNGARTIDQMKAELQQAGYNGPWSVPLIVAKYSQTARGPVIPTGGSGGSSGGGGAGSGGSGGGSGTGGGGINDLINAGLYGNQQEFDLKKNAQDFGQQNTRDARYDALRQSELNRYDQNNQFNLNRYDQNNQYNLNRFDQNTNREEGRYDQNVNRQLALNQAEEGRYDQNVNRQLALNQGEEGRLDQRLGQQLGVNQDVQGQLTNRLGQQLQNQQFQQSRFDTQQANDRSLYSTLAQNLLNSAVQLHASPRDYFKYNQMTAGGKDIFQQLYGDQPVADFAGFTGGEPEAGRITDVLGALGMPQVPGGGSVGSAGRGGAEQAFLAQQGITPMGDAGFFGQQAEARDQRFLGANGYQQTPLFGPQATTRDQAFLGANGYQRTPLFGAQADQRQQSYLGANGYQRTPLFGAQADQREGAFVGNRVGPAPTIGPAPYTPEPNLPMMPAVTDYRTVAGDAANRTIADYQGLIGSLGVPYLSSNDPRLLQLYQTEGGLDPGSARSVAEKAADYYKATGKSMPPNILAGYMNDAYSGQYNTQPNQTAVRNIGQAWADQTNAAGVDHFPASDPRTTDIYQHLGGLNPGAAGAAAGGAANFYTQTGRPADPNDLVGIINRARAGQVQQPYPGLGARQRQPAFAF